jgi:hypothetical protein
MPLIEVSAGGLTKMLYPFGAALRHKSSGVRKTFGYLRTLIIVRFLLWKLATSGESIDAIP